ncbi:hypothetical protein BDY19DRAFT_914273 [Irpex rosettiformis]|uniref:Uncharacterized protein n=1 Tax=Irpex rosettiformis TaxID=378272 RepID=A0ACB8UJW8_9APHY|nr:hypothetical protein BDY19DRAFT_914273 [Irpex rosettiformis]
MSTSHTTALLEITRRPAPHGTAPLLDIDLQYPCSPSSTTVTSESPPHPPTRRPVISLDIHYSAPMPPSSSLGSASTPSLPPISAPDTPSACSSTSFTPSTDHCVADSPQMLIFNSPLIPRAQVEYIPQIHRRLATADVQLEAPNGCYKSPELRSPPVIPTLLPDAMSRVHPSSELGNKQIPAHSPTSSARRLSLSSTYLPSPSSSIPSVVGTAPYLHPHTQSYAALASASASSSSSRIVPTRICSSKKREGSPHPDTASKPTSPSTTKRRKMWVHTLEKNVFSTDEIASLTAPARRTIYTASLESHIDKLHNELLRIGRFPASPEQLEPYHGLNSKTAKSMAAGLHSDIVVMRTRLASMRRAVSFLTEICPMHCTTPDYGKWLIRRIFAFESLKPELELRSKLYPRLLMCTRHIAYRVTLL